MSKILAVILARGGSKSIKKKNLALVNGHPLIAYTIVEALKSNYIDRVIVSSDDEEIRAVSIQYGAEAPFSRPELLSGDAAKPVECDLHATHWAENNKGVKYDFVVELLCTNPFKTHIDINNALKIQIDTNADSVIAVCHLEDHHPIRIKKIVNGMIKDFCLEEIPESRRQDLDPPAYIRSGSIYVTKIDFLLEHNSRYGGNITASYILPEERVINIDELDDFILAEIKLGERK